MEVKDTAKKILNSEGNVIYFEGSLEDITEQLIAQEALENNERELRILNAEKDKFFSIVAHDLKSAFNSMLGFSDLLIKNFDNYDQDKKKKFVDIIQQSIQNTYKLLENLLVWSRAQRGIIDYNPEIHNLYLMTDETIGILQQTADNKAVSIINSISESIFVHVDKNMVLTILRNLINNAVKFTPKKGEVKISAVHIKSDDHLPFVRIAVKDNGIGIKKESLEKLFKLSESLSTKGTDNEPGTGLGLILCKDFVEKHGGEMNVESEPGKGSIFEFTLPTGQL
jgi:signal transduction histidine kinase